MKKITYISIDNKSFFCPIKCAEYEIENIPIVLEKIEVITAGKTQEYKTTWYDEQENGYLYNKSIAKAFIDSGLNVFHWEVWITKYHNN